MTRTNRKKKKQPRPTHPARARGIPEKAFQDGYSLRFDPAYGALLDRMVEKSDQQKQKFNHRFYYGALPIGILGGLVGTPLLQLAHYEIFGTKPPSVVQGLESMLSYALALTVGVLVTGAWKHKKVLSAIREPILKLKNYTSERSYTAPVPPDIRQAVRRLEALDKKLPDLSKK